MNNLEIREIQEKIFKIEENISEIFIGKHEKIRLMLLGLFSGLHVLITDVPGVGKTTLTRCCAASTGMDFARIQFTPDLLPGDIVGMTVWDIERQEFVFKQGAIMHQFILADEINRATPRTQSSLLEAMQDGTVSVDGKTWPLAEPFFVIATQNPPSFLGTYHLPEVELDRFGIGFALGYPDDPDAAKILSLGHQLNPFKELKPVVKPKDIVDIRKKVQEIHVSDAIKAYVVSIAKETRASKYISLGMSVRAMQHLLVLSRAFALLAGRDFVIPEDIMDSAIPVVTHRLVFTADMRIENKTPQSIIETIFDKIKKPV
ncbi:MAG: MoxR family ATPase [Spirochaetales bacterium]|nr:MoxR family ATPase [Spirochaetales bacterium]